MKCILSLMLLMMSTQIKSAKVEDKPDRHITVTLVRKDWKPPLKYQPLNEEILPKYPGPAEDAYFEIKDPKNMYTSIQKRLEDSAEQLLTDGNGYDSKLESIFVLQVALEETEGLMLRDIALAMAMRNMVKKYNLFSIDLRNYATSNIKSVVNQAFGIHHNYTTLRKYMGEFFNSAIELKKIEPNKIHLIGFCWTSQLAGYLGRDIGKKWEKSGTLDGNIRSILALDPHSFGLRPARMVQHLKISDALVVHAYHTNSLVFGTQKRYATDISFNGGFFQPGCKFFDFYCNHGRAMLILKYVILFPDSFLASRCTNFQDFKHCKCNEKNPLQLSFPPSTSEMANYYMYTSAQIPYGVGFLGSQCIKHLRKNDPTVRKEKYEKELQRRAGNVFTDMLSRLLSLITGV